MKIQEMVVTPKLAKSFLAKNHANRPINDKLVKAYARDMSSGNWQLTHQGLLLDINGHLVDGQHRLHACIKSGMSFSTLVCQYENKVSPLDLSVDTGLKRTPSFIHNVPNPLASCASFALRVIYSEVLVTISERRDAIDQLEPQFALLTKTAVRGITQAPLMVAVMTHMRQFPANQHYFVDQYAAAVHSDYQKMTPRVGSLYKQIVTERRKIGGNALFARAYRAFSFHSRNATKLLIKDDDVAFEEAKAALISTWDLTGGQ